MVFSEPIFAHISNLRLTNLGMDAPETPDVNVELDEAQLSIDGAELLITLPPGLSDGVYQLEILDSLTDLAGNPLDGNNDGQAGDHFVWTGNLLNRLYQLLGDFNGDGGTSIFDFSTFSYWFGGAFPDVPEYVDLNGDRGVSIFDFPCLCRCL